MDHQLWRKLHSDFLRYCRILQNIEKQYPDGSEEQEAIRNAAAALHLGVLSYPEEFIQERDSIGAKLTDEQKAMLRSKGLKADDDST
jgi:hypothetical protein